MGNGIAGRSFDCPSSQKDSSIDREWPHREGGILREKGNRRLLPDAGRMPQSPIVPGASSVVRALCSEQRVSNAPR